MKKAMLSMQIPSQEACLKNTRTFKDKAPKAELDGEQKTALASCPIFPFFVEMWRS